MTWRTVVISSNCKLDLKLNYMVVRGTEVRKIHLSEISVLIIESTAVSMTAMLLCELSRRKVRIVFCDESHNPYGELESFYGCHDSADKLRSQIRWDDGFKKSVWDELIREKIDNQSYILKMYDYDRSELLKIYEGEVCDGDVTNREGHAAKVYFNGLFGNEFSRKKDCNINAALNYGYSILLSAVNREIVCLGYSTQLGIFHDNMFNHFNLGSDLMEPLRPLVDHMVLDREFTVFDTDTKRYLAGLLNEMVVIDGKAMHLLNALPIYVKSVMDALESGDVNGIKFCRFSGEGDETDRLF